MSNDLRIFVCDFQIDKLESICYLAWRLPCAILGTGLGIWCLPKGLTSPTVF
jgi:hypothetical protein